MEATGNREKGEKLLAFFCESLTIEVEEREFVDIEVNYRSKKRYKTAKYPLHQTKFWTWLIWLLSKFALQGKEYKIEKINMEGLKLPYLLLCNEYLSSKLGFIGLLTAANAKC